MSSPLSSLLGPVKQLDRGPAALTIRPVTSADAAGVARLAELDSARLPTAPVLAAEVAGELWAAVSIADGSAVADPFKPTGELVALLHERARQVRRSTH